MLYLQPCWRWYGKSHRRHFSCGLGSSSYYFLLTIWHGAAYPCEIFPFQIPVPKIVKCSLYGVSVREWDRCDRLRRSLRDCYTRVSQLLTAEGTDRWAVDRGLRHRVNVRVSWSLYNSLTSLTVDKQLVFSRDQGWLSSKPPRLPPLVGTKACFAFYVEGSAVSSVRELSSDDLKPWTTTGTLIASTLFFSLCEDHSLALQIQ